MPQDKELEIQLQFLEEAQDHLNTIEENILGISTAGISRQRMDVILRAAHSIKGGAAVMGFQTLSDLAHRQENFFKAIKSNPQAVEVEVESLLLAAVDSLRQVVVINRQTPVVEEKWLESEVNLVFEQLYQRLGDPKQEETVTVAPQEGLDMGQMLFETEVEAYLQQLEAALANPDTGLSAQVTEIAQDLSDLGEMLQMSNFNSLCVSVKQQIEATPERTAEIAQAALQVWRRSQAAVLIGQSDTIPSNLDLDKPEDISIPVVAVPKAPIVTSRSDMTAIVSEKPDVAPDLKEQENTVRVPLKQLEELNDLFGELTIERSGLDLQLERLRNSVKILERRVRSLEQSETRRRTSTYQKYSTPSPTSPAAKLLSDVAFSGEPQPSIEQPFVLPVQSNKSHNQSEPDSISLEVTANIVQLQEVTEDIELCLQETDQIVGDLNLTAKQLQNCISQLRMRPFSDLVGRFPEHYVN